MKGVSKLTVFLVAAIVLGVGGYWAYQSLLPKVLQVVPTPVPIQTSTTQLPVVVEPKSGATVKSPLKVRGTVPPSWMFEGVFPIKLMDSDHNIIVQGSATEEVVGSWQSNVPVYFNATLTFTTTAKSGFIVLGNDNPSGDPSKSTTFEIPVAF